MLNYTAWPEMLAWPYLMLQGWLPYKDIAIAHNPLMLLDLTIFFKLFGVGILQLKIYTWIVILINTALLYLVSKKYWDKKIAYFSCLLYLLLVVIYEGNGLWFDLALTPFAMLLYYLLRQKSYLWAGIVFVLGYLTKQTFIYFTIPVILFLLKDKIKMIANVKKLIIGGLVIFVPFVLILYLLGIVDDYYKWAVEFGIFYLPKAEGQISLPNIRQFVFAMSPFLFLLFTNNYFLIIFTLVGLLGVYPRWELFHFQPALPFLAIAITTFLLDEKFKRIPKYILFVFLLLFLTIGIKRQVGTTTRFYEEDVIKITQKVKDSKIESLYVINYWDNLYALTDTLPPKPLIPYIPWYLSYNNNVDLLISNLKKEMVDAIVIGERQDNYPKLYEFVDKFYTCDIVDKKVELCIKNN